jgi:proteasome lid subunit RPN8/RPN11
VTTVRAAAIQDMIDHARQTYPAECCGLLVGIAGSEEPDRPRHAAILEALPAHNDAADTTRRYLLRASDHIHTRRAARARGLSIVGFYHSHPSSSPEPSQTDLEEAAYPDFLYLIVGTPCGRPQLGLFRFDGRSFESAAWEVSG